MAPRIAKILAATIALGFGLEISFAPGAAPGAMSEALAFGHGGFGGGGHFGGGGGHFGGFGGGHFGGFGGARFGGFGGGHFGRPGGFAHFGGFRGGHFGGMHFGRFGGGRVGVSRFAGSHFGGRHFAGSRFGAGHFGHANLAAHQLGGAAGRIALAHNGLGAAGFGRFNGVHGFDPHGFNRNAFGSMAAWNRWGGNAWGAGWGYWAGPVFWPFFFGDVLSFALWPYGLYDPFLAYGPDFLLASLFWPGPSLWPYYAYDGGAGLFDIYGSAPYAENYAAYGYDGSHWRHRRHPRYVARSVAEAAPGTESAAAPTCGGLAPGVVNLPIGQIDRAIRPTDAQIPLLNDLETAAARAGKILQSSCPAEVPLTPVGRLDAVASRIQAMIEAVQILRPALATLYNSLDDAQKQRFAAIGAQGEYGRARTTGEASPAGDLAALCKQQVGNFTLLPVQRIEDAIKPTEQQKLAFDALKSVSAKAAADLGGSCPAEMPQTLTDRLDLAAKRLEALANAVDTVKPALNDFYNMLSDEQKARFNVIGRSADAAAP